MSVEQFEDFIVSQFVNWASGSIIPGERFQFKSPSNDVRKKIYHTLISLAGGKSINYQSLALPYLTLGEVKLLPLLHLDDDEGFNEHFLAHLRDEPESSTSPLYGIALLFIHNSTLDTIVNSSGDLAYDEGIWHPSAIKRALEKLIDEKDENLELSKCLLNYQFDAIQEDGATMFGFEKLYNALLDGNLQFHELGLFNDPFIKTLSGDSNQIRKRLDENSRLYRSIEQDVEHFSGQLQNRLKQFSSSFINKHFSKDDHESWKKVDFQEYRDEIKRNEKSTLILEDTSSELCEHIARSSGQSKVAQRQFHAILQVPESVSNFDFTATFSGNDLETNQLSQPNKLLPIGSELKATKGSKRCKLSVQGEFNGNPLFFTVGTGGRDRSTEKYSFHCLVLRKGEFYVEAFKNNFTIVTKTNVINLHTNEYNLLINPQANQKIELHERGEVINAETTREVDFKTLANNSDLIDFKVEKGEHHLLFNIEGEVATESLTLPLLFDKDRFSRLFEDNYYGEFSRHKEKILIDNKEITPISTRLNLLRWEAEFVDRQLIMLEKSGGLPLSELSAACPVLYKAYIALYAYLKERETLPSLASWGNEYRQRIRHIVTAYIDYLEKIQVDTVLNSNDKLVLKIGMVRSQDCEYFSPYHPLVMSYYLALVDQIVEDKDNESFKYLPHVTMERLTPRGLIPYLYDTGHEFSYVQQLKENPTWLKAVPYEESNYDYVRKVVKEKIGEFQRAFSQLFRNSRSKLLINAVNQQQCKELFLGIVDYFKQDLDNTHYVHVNIYDEQLQFNWFDKFAEISSPNKLKEMLELDKGKNKEIADTLIDLLRIRLTYSKFTHKEALEKGQAYAHLTFFRNEKKIQSIFVNIDACISGVAADGFLSGEASESKGESYFTAFGLRDTTYKDISHLKIAKLFGALIKPARESNAQYIASNVIALAVNEGFKELLESTYQASIWTTIIDPKVTLDFFRNQDLTLIHFSDQYTASAGYDAITVTREKELYRRVLEQGQGGRIEEFNAFNGDWLLRMLTAKDSARKGIEGEIGAYKFVTSMLAASDITWVPLSIGEMVRVSGNIGLRIMDSEFAPGVHGSNEGPMSDDILIVGFKNQQLFLLPVEVKTGAPQGYDKAIVQVKNLLEHLTNMLGRKTFANKIYRALFMRQVLIQIDKYRLYEVFDNEYFNDLLASREKWLRGEYQLAKLDPYPDGIVVAHVDSPSVFEPTYKEVDSILCIELPFSFLPKLVSTPLKDLMAVEKVQEICHVPTEYLLGAQVATKNVVLIENKQSSEIGQVDEFVISEHSLAELPFNEEVPQVEESITKVTFESSNSQWSGKHLSVLLGHRSFDQAAVFWEPTNTNKVFNTNTGIIGTMGTGKTQFTKSLITQLIHNQKDNLDGQPIGILIFDYKADYIKEDFVKATNATVYDLHNLPFNPLALVGNKPMLPVHTASQFRATLSKAFGLGPKQENRIHELVMQAYDKCGITPHSPASWSNIAPTIQTVWDLYLDQEKVEQDSLYAALYELNTFQIFETNSEKTASLYDTLNGVVVINLSGYDPKIQNLVVAITLDIFYAQMHQHGSSKLDKDYRQITKMVLVDEADNFISQEFESLKKILKEGREFGVGTILSTQELTHFKAGDEDYSSYILSWVIHRVSKIKNQEIKAIFNSKDKLEEERLMQQIRQLEKHYSLYVDGEKQVTKIHDKPFWELWEGIKKSV
jgi:DNA phosphorothioation-dependent restriction protein DptH